MRARAGCAFTAAAQLHAVHAGHPHIGEDQVGPFALDQRQPFFGIRREVEIMPRAAQHHADHLPDQRLVLAEDDRGHHSLPPWRLPKASAPGAVSMRQVIGHSPIIRECG